MIYGIIIVKFYVCSSEMNNTQCQRMSRSRLTTIQILKGVMVSDREQTTPDPFLNPMGFLQDY